MDADVTVIGDVTVTSNTVGMELKGTASATFTGDGGNTLNINDNQYGVIVDNGSVLAIDDMNIKVTGNSDNGIRVYGGGEINLTGDSDNALQVGDNGQTGIVVGSGGNAAILNVTGMDVNISKNSDNGIDVNDGSKVTMSDMEKIDINENTHSGMRVFGTSAIEIKGSGTTAVNINNNNTGDGWASGVFMEGDGKVNISYANVEINENGNLGGIRAIDNSTVEITGDGSNTLKINGNSSAGVTLNGAGAALTVTGMNVNIDSNKAYTDSSGNRSGGNAITGNNGTGIYTVDAHGGGGAVVITQVDKLLVNSNNYGIDIAYSGGSAIISDVNKIEFNDNNKQGVLVNYSATITMTGNSSGTTSFSANENRDNGIEAANKGMLTMTGMDMEMNGNSTIGLNVNRGATATITGSVNVQNKFSASGNKVSGIVANDTDSGTAAAIEIINMDMTVDSNDSYGIQAAKSGQIDITGNGNTLSLDGNGSYGLMATGNGSVDITGMVITGDSLSNNFVGIEGDGDITLTDSSITTGTDTLFYVDGASGQTGTIILDGTAAIGNGTKLAYFDADKALFEAKNSYLENAIVTNNGTSTVSLDNSTWLMLDSSNITNFTAANNTTVDMRSRSGGYNTLSVNGLTSNDTTYLINTYFDQPGLTTDKIIVGTDGATGTNNVIKVTVTGTDGLGVVNGYGIQVVYLDGGTASKAVDFSLYGGLVDVGAYYYWLYRAADDNYYLQTRAGNVTSTAREITNMPSVQLSMIGAGTKEMRKRLFELRHNDLAEGNELWIRGFTSSMTVNDVARSKLDVYGVEAGYDHEIYNNDDDVVYLGLMAGFMHTENIRHHTSASRNGSATGEAPSVGLYGIWFNTAGWFAYANLRHFWLDMDAKGYTYSGDSVTYNPDRNFVTANFELGKQFKWQIEDNKRQLII